MTASIRDERQLFAEVVLPHLDDALSLARWLTGNATDAEDVVQEASIRAYSAIRSADVSKARAWMLAIVRNTAFTWLAKNRPKSVVVTDDEKLFEQAGLEMVDGTRDQTPEAALIDKTNSEHLVRAVQSLPPAFRDVLVLREFEDLSYQDISKALSIPIGTVMSRLARARSQLIQRIDMANKGKAGVA